MSLMIRRRVVVCLMIAACHTAFAGAQERGLVQTSAESVAGWPMDDLEVWDGLPDTASEMRPDPDPARRP